MVLYHDDADEITQEVFIKLHSSIKNFRGESSLFTYLYRIAMNYSLNHLKRNKKINEKHKNIDDENYQIRNNDLSADEMIDEKSKENILLEAISRLPEKQRAVYNLRFYDGLSYEDISKILKKSEGGLKANYFHAVKKIEEFIEKKKASGHI